MNARVYLVDVFGARTMAGNPLAVVVGADGLDGPRMLHMARWFNFSETVFLLPPTRQDADYRARIFTLDRELPFAGHPTLGCAHVWLEAGGQAAETGRIVQECGAGLVTLRREGKRLAFAAPPMVRSGPVDAQDMAEAREFLGVAPDAIMDAAWVDNGPGWLGIRLASAECVLALRPPRIWRRRVEIGVIGAHAAGADADFEVRAFFSDHLLGVLEDPVTGSLNASLAQWMFASKMVKDAYIAAQGTALGRVGRIHARRDAAGVVWIGGHTETHVTGSLTWDAGKFPGQS